ncbi:hypothetical protein Pori4_00157 [Pseudomonas phage vB_PpuM-Pori-4]
MKFVPKAIEHRDIDPTARELWVLNTTKKPASGDVFFTVPRIRGNGMDDVQVIKSWAPQNLCEQASAGQLMDSTEFRKMMTYGNIIVISPEDAQKIISKRPSDFQEEVKRILNRRQRQIDVQDAGSRVAEPAYTSGHDHINAQAADDLDMKVQSLMQPMEEGETISSDEEMRLINTLRTMEDDDELGPVETKFIQRIAKKAGKKKLLRYINEVIRQSVDDEEDDD